MALLFTCLLSVLPSTSNAAALETILNADGTLNLRSGFSGSLDVQGYRMVTSPSGAPRFLPLTVGAAAEANAPFSASPGPESGEDVYWDDQFAVRGTSDEVRCLYADGQGNLYVGGTFVSAGNVVANSIAKWNGGYWSALGSGLRYGAYLGTVMAITKLDGNLYVGGRFTTAGGVPASNIAKWNGTSWSALGTGTTSSVSYVLAFASRGTDLFVGGTFDGAGGLLVNGIAKWNGSAWSPLGSGMTESASPVRGISALFATPTDLYAAGDFIKADGMTVNHIAKWNGTSWAPLGTGLNSPALSLDFYRGQLHCAGYFSSAGGVTAKRIAKWDGATWSEVGGGIGLSTAAYSESWVECLKAVGEDLYVSGSFITAGSQDVKNIAVWNGSAWSAPPGGDLDILAVEECSGSIYAAGYFRNMGDVGAHHIAKLNGDTWSPLNPAPVTGVRALTSNGTDLFVAGDLVSAQGTHHALAKWSGATWVPLGNEPENVTAMTCQGNDLYTASSFTDWVSDKVSVAKWNGNSWQAIGGNLQQYINTIAVSGDAIYISSSYGLPATVSVAKWNGQDWQPMTNGLESSAHVSSIAANGSDVYIGGSFIGHDSGTLYNVAKWDGTKWSPLANGIGGEVYCLALIDNVLYAGGKFTKAGEATAKYIAKWDGYSWSAVGGGMNDIVHKLCGDGGQLYAVGDFTLAGSTPANRVARWNGSSWSTFGSGLEAGYPLGEALHVAVRRNSLFMGGEFMNSFSVAGGKVSHTFAHYQPRVELSVGQLTAFPGELLIGRDPFGFYRPAVSTWTGTTVDSASGLPATVSLDRADEIMVYGERVNGAFTVLPEGLSFGGTPATLWVEFSEDDVAAFGGSYSDFRAVRLIYPGNYPGSKEAVARLTVPGQSAPQLVRVENGRRIYSISVPITDIGYTYGAVPNAVAQSSGAARVSISPVEAVADGAKWRIDGGAWRKAATSASVLSVGQHLVEFQPVSGWGTPASQTINVVANQTTNVNASYAWQTGWMKVNLGPAAAVSAGAQWRMDEGTWRNSGDVISRVSVGSHTISYKDVSGWVTPGADATVVNAAQTTTLNRNYEVYVPPPDVSVSLEASSTDVAVGSPVTLTATVRNNGPGTANEVVFVNGIPPNVEVVGASASAGTVNNTGTALTCNWPTVAEGQVVTLSIILRPLTAGQLSDTATVGAARDAEYANNTATVSVAVNDYVGAATDLTVTIASTPPNLILNGNIDLTATITNNGPQPATGVSLSQNILAGTLYVASSASQGTAQFGGDVLIANVGTVQPGASATVSMTVTPTAPGTFYSTAQVSGEQSDPNGDNNSFTLAVPVVQGDGPDFVVQIPALLQTCSDDLASCKLKAKFVVTNAGNQKALAKSSLQVFLSADPVYDGSDQLLKGWNIKKLKPGKGKKKTLNVSLPAGANVSGQYLIAVADATNVVPEGNEFNNKAVYGPVQ